MGYFKILLVGLLWSVCLILPIRQWLTVLLLPVAILIPPLRGYTSKMFTSDDQNMLAFLNGNEDHTISGHVGRKAMEGKREYIQAEKVINMLFFWQPQHCRQAIEKDEL